MTATAYHSKRLDKHRNTWRLDANQRSGLLELLKHDRRSLAGKNPDYDPSLGNRQTELRKSCAKHVLRLLLS